MTHSSSSKTLWHRLLGKLLEELLTPVGISVYIDSPVMSQSPKADILLLQRDLGDWTEAQRQRLPDGIRDSGARHIVIEFKYTESFTLVAVQQSLAYDLFYKQSQNLGDAVVQTFLVCAKQPQAERLAQFGYVSTTQAGVYNHPQELLHKIILLSLNELADTPHNAFFKCFASQRAEKKKAFDQLIGGPLNLSLTEQLIGFIRGLWNYWFPLRGEDMDLEVTPEHIARLGKRWKKGLLGGLSIEEILEEVKLDDLLAHLKPEQRLAGLKPEQRLAGLKPEQRLAGLKPEEIFAAVNPQDLENYLKQLKQSPPPAKSRKK
jgi:hypothetical protein